MEIMGRMLVVLGIVITLLGLLLMFWGKIPILGKLPGDIVIKKGNFVFYFPLATSILISVILTLIFYLISRFK